MRRNRFSVLLAITAVSVLALAGSVSAATYTWIQGGDVTNWTDPLNWQGGSVPPWYETNAEIVYGPATSGNISSVLSGSDTNRVTVGSVSWQTTFNMHSFGKWSDNNTGWIINTGTSDPATFTFSNGGRMNNYYVPWTLNSDLLLSGAGSGGLEVKAASGKVRGSGGFIVESGTLTFNKTHQGANYTYTGGVTVKSGGVVDVNSYMSALGDGLLTIVEGGQVQAQNNAFDQDALFDINSTGTTSPFISGGGAGWNASGTWTFDLTDAGNSIGDSWNIIGIGGTATYGAAFSVGGFTESSGVWSGMANNAEYQFDESTGLLSVTSVVNVIPEPSTMLIWGLGLLGLGWYGWRKRFRI